MLKCFNEQNVTVVSRLEFEKHACGFRQVRTRNLPTRLAGMLTSLVLAFMFFLFLPPPPHALPLHTPHEKKKQELKNLLEVELKL